MPHPRYPKKKPFAKAATSLKTYSPLVGAVAVLAISFFSLPSIVAMDIEHEAEKASKPAFPVSVDPLHKLITESPEVEALLADDTALSASAINAGSILSWIASAISLSPAYKQVAGSDTAIVTIKPGYREEEVAQAFGSALGWTAAEKKSFLDQVHSTPPSLSEGEFVPGSYVVEGLASAEDIQAILNERFSKDILARYGTTTEAVLPLEDALTIASMLERETRNPAEMRLISGIIWNRLWSGMNLQIDATLQYAKATQTTSKSWWPKVVPDDKYVKSPYNTYKYKGLPPGPISNPSTAALLAALNPKATDCIFYFHDKNGHFTCSKTYKEHVAALKKAYGQGK
ncbi:MAG: hypothetical protein JWN64_219 [Parcubacteria group bacterium]|nr:hypothetical protein [Parcubacteria group bacterium]